eukprot:Nk52_evm4s659 gene=Nk52_evmTU4s659
MSEESGFDSSSSSSPSSRFTRVIQSLFADGKAIAYGSFSFSILIIHNVFLIFYVKMFLSVYGIDQWGFYVGQMIFLVWNSFNDPIVGWLMDRAGVVRQQTGGGISSNSGSNSSSGTSNAHNTTSSHESGAALQYQLITARIRALSQGGMLFAASFALFWFPWISPSFQFVIALCVYDTFLTFVDLSHTSLMADLTVDGSERARMSSWVSMFSIVACGSVFFAYFMWDEEAHWGFSGFCVFLSVLSACGFVVSGKFLQAFIDQDFKSSSASAGFPKAMQLTAGAGVKKEQEGKGNKLIADFESGMKFFREMMEHRNFVLFSLMNLVQVFHCHFNSNFFPYFLQKLVQGHLSQAVCGLLLGLSFVVPHLNNVYFSSLAETKGVYVVIKYLFLTKLVLALFMLMQGSNSLLMVSFFIVSNRIFTEGTCKLLNLVIADLIDEDWILHRRPQSVSALIFGLSNLMSKPGQTLAPVLGTWLLGRWGVDSDEVFDAEGILRAEQVGKIPDDKENEVVFNLLVYVPILCAICQLLVWSQFSLQGQNLRIVRMKVAEMKGGLMNGHQIV